MKKGYVPISINANSFDGIDRITFHKIEGDIDAYVGDYIIKGIKGEFYPCRKDIFEELYELQT